MSTKPLRSNLKYISIHPITLKRTYDHDLYINDLEEYVKNIEEEYIDIKNSLMDDIGELESENNLISNKNEKLKEEARIHIDQIKALRKLINQYESKYENAN